MTGTASELCDYNECDYSEKEPRNLNRFDLFSLWLLKKAGASRLTAADLCKGFPMLKIVDSTISIHDEGCSMTDSFMCDSPAISK